MSGLRDLILRALETQGTQESSDRHTWDSIADAVLAIVQPIMADRDRLDVEALKWTEIAGQHAADVGDLTAALATLRAAAVVLPKDWRHQIETEGTSCCGDAQEVIDLIEDWRRATTEGSIWT